MMLDPTSDFVPDGSFGMAVQFGLMAIRLAMFLGA
jgi:hypothetical protein